MYEKALGLGVGYLVYKRIMSELAMAPDTEGVKLTSEGLLGFKGLTQEELAEAIFGGQSFSDVWGKGPEDPGLMKRGEYAKMYDTLARRETITGGQWDWGIPTEDWGSLQRPAILFPEGFELVGPSRTGITRPKGLD